MPTYYPLLCSVGPVDGPWLLGVRWLRPGPGKGGSLGKSGVFIMDLLCGGWPTSRPLLTGSAPGQEPPGNNGRASEIMASPPAAPPRAGCSSSCVACRACVAFSVVLAPRWGGGSGR